MDAISYERATDITSAVRAAQQPGTMFIGGGTKCYLNASRLLRFGWHFHF